MSCDIYARTSLPDGENNPVEGHVSSCREADNAVAGVSAHRKPVCGGLAAANENYLINNAAEEYLPESGELLRK